MQTRLEETPPTLSTVGWRTDAVAGEYQKVCRMMYGADKQRVSSQKWKRILQSCLHQIASLLSEAIKYQVDPLGIFDVWIFTRSMFRHKHPECEGGFIEMGQVVGSRRFQKEREITRSFLSTDSSETMSLSVSPHPLLFEQYAARRQADMPLA